MKINEFIAAMGFDPVTENALARADEHISFDTNLTLRVLDTQAKLRAAAYDENRFLAELRTAQSEAGHIGLDPALYTLYLVASLMGERERDFIAHGIDGRVYRDTALDVRLWADEYIDRYRRPGLGEQAWLSRHVAGRLFRLGRLQFELPLEAGIFGEAGGSHCLGVHIAKDGKLDFDACRDSFAAAPEFFAKLGVTVTGFACHSWILWPGLRDILPGNSNLVRFSRFFPIIAPDDDGSQAIERIFGWKYAQKPLSLADKALLPDDTALRRAAKSLLMEGRSLGAGQGVAPADIAEVTR